MKLVLLAVVLSFAIPGLVLGQRTKQNAALEQEVRRLDMAEAGGLLHKDVAALEKLWQKILRLIIRVTE